MEQRIALGYGLFICLVVLVSAYLWYIYALLQRNVATNVRFDPGEAASSDAEAGIDQATLECYPKMPYSQAKLEKGTTATCCSICLGDYRDADVLQMLPYSQAKLEKGTTATCCSICLGDYRDADVLQMLPYSQAKLEKGTTATCCSICLGDYRDADVLQMLPQSGHHFHVDCINRWLRSHASCPNCRSLPAPGS